MNRTHHIQDTSIAGIEPEWCVLTLRNLIDAPRRCSHCGGDHSTTRPLLVWDPKRSDNSWSRKQRIRLDVTYHKECIEPDRAAIREAVAAREAAELVVRAHEDLATDIGRWASHYGPPTAPSLAILEEYREDICRDAHMQHRCVLDCIRGRAMVAAATIRAEGRLSERWEARQLALREAFLAADWPSVNASEFGHRYVKGTIRCQ